MITSNVADGIHLLSHAHVNCYLVEDEDGVTVVDAGLPSMWPMVLQALEDHNRTPEQVKALVLTHAHFDHVGFAARAQQTWGVPILVHRQDARLAARPYRYTPQRNRFLYPLRHPKSLPVLGRMVAAGALTVKGINDVRPLSTGDAVPIPGRPIAVHTPGHTDGHCILHLPERDTVITGDALVTLDPYTGRTGPQLVAAAATKAPAQALTSLEAVATTGATTVLPGHGHPWTQGAAVAVRQALVIGAH